MINFFTLAQLSEKRGDMCFYSTNTIWWGSRWEHLQKGPVPLDIFGSPCFQSEKTEQFFDAEKIRAQPAYGKYPVTTWTLAHHSNLTWITKTMGERFNHDFRHPSLLGYTAWGEKVAELVEKGLLPNFEPKA